MCGSATCGIWMTCGGGGCGAVREGGIWGAGGAGGVGWAVKDCAVAGPGRSPPPVCIRSASGEADEPPADIWESAGMGESAGIGWGASVYQAPAEAWAAPEPVLSCAVMEGPVAVFGS